MWEKNNHQSHIGHGKNVAPIAMVMTGGLFIIVLPTKHVLIGNSNRETSESDGSIVS